MNGKLKKVTASILSSAIALGICTTALPTNVMAATEHWNDASAEATSWSNWKQNWDAYSSNYENVSMTPGANETQLNYAWYSHTQETPKVKLAKKEDMSDAVEFTGEQTTAVVISDVQYYSNKVTVTGLEENTKYFYSVLKNGQWSDTEVYSTKSFSNFSFLYVGDPQIGASKGQTSTEADSMNAKNDVTTTAEDNLAARNDSYNWDKVLKLAMEDHENVSFMVSAGDQINYAANEREYAGYLGAEALKSLPVSTTIGNHDSGSNQYSLHYNNPNSFSEEQTDYTQGKSAAGTDYYYTYGNVLFIVIDTNNYNCATHDNVIKKAVEENKDAKWRVVMFHQDIYGSGKDHSDSDGMVLRTQLTPIFDKYDIDVVLQGHDHTYSRTYQLQGDGKEHTAYNSSDYRSDDQFKAQNNCYEIVSDTVSGTVVNPEGTVYLEANSATGSKFYELIASKQDFISERSQTWTPSYSVIDTTEDTFTMTAYDASTGKTLGGSSSYTIVKKENPTDTTITGAESYTKEVGDAAFKLDVKSDSDGKITYESSNEDVAIVSANGKVAVTGVGEATITVKVAATESKNEATKTVKITVKEKAHTHSQTSVVNKKAATYFAKGYSGDTVCTSCNAVVAKGKATAKKTLKTPKVTVSADKKLIKVKYTKVSDANGFVVSYTKGNKTYTKTFATKKSATKVIKKLKAGNYKVKVRAYVKSGKNTEYSAWTKAKTVKVK